MFFLLQYLGKWNRTNGPLVNLFIFNSSNENKARDINSLRNLLVVQDLALYRRNAQELVQTMQIIMTKQYLPDF